MYALCCTKPRRLPLNNKYSFGYASNFKEFSYLCILIYHIFHTMDKKPYITHSHDVNLDNEYNQWLTELIGRYRHAQIKAAVKVNSEKLLWGTSNLWYMKKWYVFYTEKLQRTIGETNVQDAVILQRAVGELYNNSHIANNTHIEHTTGDEGYNFPSLFASVPWGQHIEIISRCKTLEEAVFYLNLTVAESLSRLALLNCIKSNVYHKRGRALTNFTDKLPMPQAKLAQDLTRSNYDFGFIKLPDGFSEKQLEDALCNQMNYLHYTHLR